MCNHISKKRGTVKCNRVKNMKQDKVKYDFKAFGQAIKAARKAKGISRNQLADTLNIAPRNGNKRSPHAAVSSIPCLTQ